jgi:hypothetical protein
MLPDWLPSGCFGQRLIDSTRVWSDVFFNGENSPHFDLEIETSLLYA